MLTAEAVGPFPGIAPAALPNDGSCNEAVFTLMNISCQRNGQAQECLLRWWNITRVVGRYGRCPRQDFRYCFDIQSARNGTGTEDIVRSQCGSAACCRSLARRLRAHEARV